MILESIILGYMALIHFHVTYRSNCLFSQCMIDVDKEEDTTQPLEEVCPSPQ